MAIDRSVVEKAAGLARIALTPDEVERFTGQLSVVLAAVERLKAVDTEKVSPTASVLPVSHVMREDEIRPGLSREEALANAPKGGRDGEFFRVQAVLEERPWESFLGRSGKPRTSCGSVSSALSSLLRPRASRLTPTATTRGCIWTMSTRAGR